MLKRIADFAIDVKGSVTEERFQGVFETKTVLSMRDMVREDEVRRRILGENAEAAGEYVRGVAGACAYLAVRITKAPTWWTESQNGLELEDENVLIEVNNACVKAIDAAYKQHTDEAEAARKELKEQT